MPIILAIVGAIVSAGISYGTQKAIPGTFEIPGTWEPYSPW
ncbi:hypothetical protein [Bacillus cereus]|nr:hypothetical protein [Bacillus cereus]